MTDYINTKVNGQAWTAEDAELIEAASATKQDKDIGTNNRAIVSGSTGELEVSATTKTEISYIGGVTSPIQDQINSLSGGGTGTGDLGTPIDLGSYDADITLDVDTAAGSVFKLGVSDTTTDYIDIILKMSVPGVAVGNLYKCIICVQAVGVIGGRVDIIITDSAGAFGNIFNVNAMTINSNGFSIEGVGRGVVRTLYTIDNGATWFSDDLLGY